MDNSYTLDEWSMQSKYLIMVPYAYAANMETGLNVTARNNRKHRELYLKNCCVALVSAKTHNPEADVALVTNIEVPEPYTTILKQAGVAVIYVPFNKFNVGEKYVWGLAFYKLCAQYYISHYTAYEAVACIDSDTYTQGNFGPIWKSLQSSVMLYWLGCGRPKADVSKIYAEAEAFRGTNEDFTHYGGEFLVASSANLRMISEKAEVIFNKMQESGYQVTTGDEFILSVVANDMHNSVQLANDYVYRFWTGAWRNISPAYKTGLLCLHVPSEKEVGMIRLFNRLYIQGQITPKEKAWKLLHLSHRSMIETVKFVIRKIMKSLH